MKNNHNTLAVGFSVLTIAVLALLVHHLPEIGIAPLETAGRDMLRVAIFFVAWTISLRFLGGWRFSVTQVAKELPYGIVAIACSLILGCALVLMK